MMRSLAAALLLALAATPASATTADDVCSPAADPCTLTKGTTLTVTTGSILDFGDRAFVLPSGSGTKLDFGDGVVEIRARSVTLNPGSAILGPGGSLAIETTGDVSIMRDGNTKARIDVSQAFFPGSISIQTTGGGHVVVEGILSAAGTQADGGFGTIAVDAAGDILVPGEILATGGSFALGGEIVLTAAGEVNASGLINAAAGDGGGIDILAGGRVLTSVATVNSRLDVRATAGGGAGGTIAIASEGDITLGSPLHAQGEPSLELGGDGGEIVVDAGQSLFINNVVNLFGTVLDGFGGEAEFVAGLDLVQVGSILADGKRGFGAGGAVFMLAERNLTLGNVNVSANCPECAGGDFEAEAWCMLSLPALAVIDATGNGGGAVLQGGGTMTLGGTIIADATLELLYRPGGSPPVTTGATLIPAPTLILDPSVIPCGGLPGAACGDFVVDEGEQCDDGNTMPCDGCSSICTLEECGNDRLDCGETCDDGNTTNCDPGGCNATCTRSDDVCGDGIVECGETCDPGDAIGCDADGCSASCRVETCGNGLRECNEACDEGGATATCDATCQRLAPLTCGDGVVDPGEQCDDGNTLDCDGAGVAECGGAGCSSLCECESCGNGIVDCDEECDDVNLTPCDGCDELCREEICGNGRIDCGEECDEGEQNGQPGSGCLAEVCRFAETCSAGSTSPCIPCADHFDCDPLGQCGGVACLDGICDVTDLDCDDANPCTQDACDPTAGCTNTPLTAAEVPECTAPDGCSVATCDPVTGCSITAVGGFDRVTCRLDTLRALLDDPGVDAKARRNLEKRLGKVDQKIAQAAAGDEAGKTKKVRRGLTKGGKLLGKMRRKVEKFAGTKLPLDSAAALTSDIDDATTRIGTLRSELGV